MPAQLLSLNQIVNLLKLTNYRPILLISLIQHLRILKMFNKITQTLKSCIRQMTNLNITIFTFSDLNLNHLAPLNSL